MISQQPHIKTHPLIVHENVPNVGGASLTKWTLLTMSTGARVESKHASLPSGDLPTLPEWNSTSHMPFLTSHQQSRHWRKHCSTVKSGFVQTFKCFFPTTFQDTFIHKHELHEVKKVPIQNQLSVYLHYSKDAEMQQPRLYYCTPINPD